VPFYFPENELYCGFLKEKKKHHKNSFAEKKQALFQQNLDKPFPKKLRIGSFAELPHIQKRVLREL
jgi:hypothetical protein